MDGDGDLDIVTISWLPADLSWYENDGAGNFGPSQNIDNQVYGSCPFAVADIDNDGDNDILSCDGLGIIYYKNDSVGNFSPAVPISSTPLQILALSAADFDNDGDIDIATSRYFEGEIALFKNDSLGTFGPKSVIDTSYWNHRILYSADLNNDSYFDLVSVSRLYNGIYFYLNDGLGNFGPQQTVTAVLNAPKSVLSADIDADGYLDVVTAAADKSIKWYKNLGAGNFLLQETIPNDIGEAGTAFASDLDNDGDIDLLSGLVSEGRIVWYPNNGNGVFGSPQDFSFNPTNDTWNVVKAADLDNDGDNDVLACWQYEHKLSWFKNYGSGVFGFETVIAFPVWDIYDFCLSDLDGDGDLDIVAGGEYQVEWYENNGMGSFGPPNPIPAYWANSSGRTIEAADLDNDGDNDVIWGSGYASWNANDGAGNFGLIQNLGPVGEKFKIVDLDNDGDLDIVGTLYMSTGGLAWMENLGDGTFTDRLFLDDSIGYSNSLYPIDLDNDGDLDILYNSYWYDMLLWAENKGYLFEDTVTICENEGYTLGNQTYNTPGQYIDSTQSFGGLDSVTSIALFVNPIPVVSLSPFANDTVCIEEGIINLPQAYPPGGIFSGNGINGSLLDLNLIGLGSYEITYLFTDTTSNCSNSDTCHFFVITCIGIDEHFLSMGISVYPNPTNRVIIIENNGSVVSGSISCRLFNNMGKEIRVENFMQFPYQLDLSNIEPGVYFLMIAANEESHTWKIVKQ